MTAAAQQRSDLKRAFDHLTSVPLAGETIDDLVRHIRVVTHSYGDVVPRTPLSGIAVVPVDADGVPAEWLIPDDAAAGRRFVYLHGGGWIAGSPESHRAMAARLAKATKAALLLVEYRLAPENPYPAGVEDCHSAYLWACANGPDGSSTAGQMFVGGDSCGGNLATVLVSRLVAQDARVPDALVLISPVLDATLNPERPDREGDPICSSGGFGLIKDFYTKGAIETDHPTVSPLYLADDILSRFPPTLIQVSGAEFLLWDAEKFAHRLGLAGARVTISTWPDMPHVWHLFDNFLPEAPRAAAEVGRFFAEESAAK